MAILFEGCNLLHLVNKGCLKKLQNPRTAPSKRTVKVKEKKKERENNAVDSGHKVLRAITKGS